MMNMLDNSNLSHFSYDAILSKWSKLKLNSNINFGALNISYCKNETERQYIINNFNWTFNDAGLNCN
jgi:hypothetical protein